MEHLKSLNNGLKIQETEVTCEFPVMLNYYKHLPAWFRIINSPLVFPAAARTFQRTTFIAVVIHDLNNKDQ